MFVPQQEALKGDLYFVSGIYRNIGPEKITEYFSRYGKVVYYRPHNDPNGKFCGYGWLLLQDSTCSVDQLENNVDEVRLSVERVHYTQLKHSEDKAPESLPHATEKLSAPREHSTTEDLENDSSHYRANKRPRPDSVANIIVHESRKATHAARAPTKVAPSVTSSFVDPPITVGRTDEAKAQREGTVHTPSEAKQTSTTVASTMTAPSGTSGVAQPSPPGPPPSHGVNEQNALNPAMNGVNNTMPFGLFGNPFLSMFSSGVNPAYMGMLHGGGTPGFPGIGADPFFQSQQYFPQAGFTGLVNPLTGSPIGSLQLAGSVPGLAACSAQTPAVVMKKMAPPPPPGPPPPPPGPPPSGN